MNTIIKNIPFVGGDTAEFEFDFGTKVAGSMAECPMRRFYSYSPTILAPSVQGTNPSNSWVLHDIQGAYDAYKSQDGAVVADSIKVANDLAQVMIELDLTALCIALFGGSNDAMQVALKSWTISTYAKGSGASGSKITVELWSATQSKWSYSQLGWGGGFSKSDTSNSIANISIYQPTATTSSKIITSDNKVYILLSAPASDGTIPSEVDLDYINIKLQFSRVPDVIAPIPISLPDTWSMLIKGFSPAWDSMDTKERKIVVFYKDGDDPSGHWFGLIRGTSNNIMLGFRNGSNAWYQPISQPLPSFAEFTTINFLISINPDSCIVRVLINGQSVLKFSANTPIVLPIVTQLYLLRHIGGNNQQADAFLNSIVFMPNKTFDDDDTEAEAVLRGAAEGFENDELFDLSKVALHPNAHIEGNSIVLNATKAYQVSTISIPVLPNNQYTISYTTDNSNIYMDMHEKYNSINLLSHYQIGGSKNGVHTFGFITSAKTNELTFNITNNATVTSGTFTWSDISLKLKM